MSGSYNGEGFQKAVLAEVLRVGGVKKDRGWPLHEEEVIVTVAVVDSAC